MGAYATHLRAMTATACLIFGAATVARAAEPSVVHTDPRAYNIRKGAHGGAGELHSQSLLGVAALDTNFIFLHRGELQPRSGIGAHFHNDCEEMFVILDGEAQFTIDGRTALLKALAGAPTVLGHSHGIYNASDRPVQWMNINVGMSKTYDAFDLGDDRVGAPLDRIPPFMTLRLDRGLLRSVTALRGGEGPVGFRRALGPQVFRTNWSYVDHFLIPAGSRVGPDRPAGLSEVIYVVKGAGSVAIDGDEQAIKEGDAVPVRTSQTSRITATGSDLELLVIGVAKDAEAKRALITAP